MPKIKFTKVTTEDKQGQPQAPHPSPTEKESKMDGVPGVESKTEKPKAGEGERRPLGVPAQISTAMVLNHAGVDKPDDDGDKIPILSPTPIERKRRRGRPPGSGSGNGKPKTQTGKVESLAKQIQGWHEMGNMFIPGLSITAPEAYMVAESMQNVIDEFDLKLNPKISAIMGLAAAVAMVEGPKMPLIMKTLQQRSQKARNREAIEKARQSQNETIPTDDTPRKTPPGDVVTANDAAGLFAHVGNGIAEGTPNE